MQMLSNYIEFNDTASINVFIIHPKPLSIMFFVIGYKQDGVHLVKEQH